MRGSSSPAGCAGAAMDVAAWRGEQHALEMAQRVAHIGSFEWDIRRNRALWSDEMHRIYGLGIGEFEGTYEAFMKRVHPEDREQTRVTLQAALERCQSVGYDHRIMRPDGTVRVLHTEADVRIDERGEPVSLVGSCWDITEQRALEEVRARWHSLLEAALESTADGIIVVDLEGGVVTCNQKFARLWRLEAPPQPGSRLQPLCEEIAKRTAGDEAFFENDCRLHEQLDGETSDVLHLRDGRVIERYGVPQRMGGKVIGRVWSFRDTTDRERLLRQSLFLSDASRMLSSMDMNEALVAVARLAVPLLGDSCAADLVDAGSVRRVASVGAAAVAEGPVNLLPDVAEGSASQEALDGRVRLSVPILVSGAVAGAWTFWGEPARLTSHGGVELAEELARRTALAMENAELYRRAREAVAARDEFLSIAAHEFRGPITALRLASQALLKPDIDEAAEEKALAIIDRENKRLEAFVNELLDIGSLRGGRLGLRPEKVDLKTRVEQTVERFGGAALRAGSRLRTKFAGNLWGCWDARRIDQVIANLVSNAIKFGEGKDVVIEARGSSDTVTLRVLDHGMGIGKDVYDRLFKPFERGVSSRHYGGLGLGLYLVHSVIESMGGTLAVDTKPGEGTIFTVTLPRDTGACGA